MMCESCGHQKSLMVDDRTCLDCFEEIDALLSSAEEIECADLEESLICDTDLEEIT